MAIGIDLNKLKAELDNVPDTLQKLWTALELAVKEAFEAKESVGYAKREARDTHQQNLQLLNEITRLEGVVEELKTKLKQDEEVVSGQVDGV